MGILALFTLKTAFLQVFSRAWLISEKKPVFLQQFLGIAWDDSELTGFLEALMQRQCLRLSFALTLTAMPRAALAGCYPLTAPKESPVKMLRWIRNVSTATGMICTICVAAIVWYWTDTSLAYPDSTTGSV